MDAIHCCNVLCISTFFFISPKKSCYFLNNKSLISESDNLITRETIQNKALRKEKRKKKIK